MDCFIGSVTLFAGNFAPRGWMSCEGQLVSIAEYTAVFAILGTTYGGDGQTTFGLPDLRGRAVVSAGQGPGLSNYSLGQTGGVENTTLITLQMPAHSHVVTMRVKPGSSSSASSPLPTNRVYAPDGGGNLAYAPASNASMGSYPATLATTVAGLGTAFESRSPYLAIMYIVCMEGIFPSRN